MKKLKYTFRKLNICIIGDSLYSCDLIYELCDQYKWRFRFKEGRSKTFWREIQTLKGIENNEISSKSTCKNEKIIQCLTYINEVSYQNRFINAVDFTETIYKNSKNSSINEKT